MAFRSPLLLLLLVLASAADANLVRNGGFEDVPGTLPGQARLPSAWFGLAMNTDTYSSDGSYGLLPDDFGNFTGRVPYEGLRFVAAANFGANNGASFGQTLSSTLIPGGRYRLTARLLQAVRIDLNRPGGYEVFLAPGNTNPVATATLLGRLGPTVAGTEWQASEFEFIAPLNAADLPRLVFEAYATRATDFAYPGLDAVTLTAVPLPGVALPFALTLAGLARRRRAGAQIC